MKVAQIMSAAEVLADAATVADAVALVVAAGVSDVMVVAEDGRFVGVLSEGDVLRAALPDLEEIRSAGGRMADAFDLFVKRAEQLGALPIAPLIIREPLVLAPDDHVAACAVVLIERFIHRLPVVDEGRLVGVVSRHDLCRALIAGTRG